MQNKKEILERATSQNGALNQSDMMIEEAAELIQAINKMKRVGGLTKDGVIVPVDSDSIKYNLTYNNLCSEVTDCRILTAQMVSMLIGVDSKVVEICQNNSLLWDKTATEFALLIVAINNLKGMGGITNTFRGIIIPDLLDDNYYDYKECYNNLCNKVSDCVAIIEQVASTLRTEQLDLIEERKLQRLRKRLLKNQY